MVPNEGDGTLQIQYATLAQWESRKLIISWDSDRNTGVAPEINRYRKLAIAHGVQ